MREGVVGEASVCVCVCVCVCGRELLQFKTVHLSALGGGGGREGELLPDVTYYQICNKSITK